MAITRNEQYIMAFAKHIKELRKKKGLAQNLIAQKMQVDYRSIERIENRGGNITISTLFALSKALDVSPMELLDFEHSKM